LDIFTPKKLHNPAQMRHFEDRNIKRKPAPYSAGPDSVELYVSIEPP